MCIAYPGRVVSVDPSGASIEIDGRLRRASTLVVPDIRAGDWVTVAAGTILERLTEAEAAWIHDRLRAAEAATAEAARPEAATPEGPSGRPDVRVMHTHRAPRAVGAGVHVTHLRAISGPVERPPSPPRAPEAHSNGRRSGDASRSLGRARDARGRGTVPEGAPGEARFDDHAEAVPTTTTTATTTRSS